MKNVAKKVQKLGVDAVKQKGAGIKVKTTVKAGIKTISWHNDP
jgi:hypothetical protein